MDLEDTAKARGFGDSICNCASCNHKVASECIKANCSCCKEINHSMVLDGIEGFTPEKIKKENSIMNKNKNKNEEQLVQVSIGQAILEGNLSIPKNPKGIVLFAHGSGSSRHSPRNKYVAQVLQVAGIATLLIDLLTEEEEEIDLQTRHLRFDIGLLAQRLIGATDWLTEEQNFQIKDLSIGYFGASTGAAAALVAAAQRQKIIKAIVSRGGRPDLAGSENLSRIQAPTLLIIGGNDEAVIEMNKDAFKQLTHLQDDEKKKKIIIIPGATHLFEEPGKLEEVADLAKNWFQNNF
jgi:putative phosphoribosyl transferase